MVEQKDKQTRRIPATNVPYGDFQNTRPFGGFAEYTERQRKAGRMVDVAAYTAIPAEIIEEDEDRAISSAKEAVTSPSRVALDIAVDSSQPVEEAASVIQDAFEKESDLANYRDFVLEGALTATNPNYNPKLARMLSNQEILVQLLQDELVKSGKDEMGFGGKALDFLDRYVIRYIPFGLWEDLTRSTERTGREIAAKAATMSPEEFTDWAINEYIPKVKEEGLFREENLFALEEAFGEAVNSGYDPMAGINQVLGIVAIADVVPILRAGVASVGVLGRVANVAGRDAAVVTARNLEKAGLSHLEEVVAEMIPGALDPAAVSNGVRPNLSGVSAIAEENAIIRDIEYLTQQGTFGRPATEEEIQREANLLVAQWEKISSRPVVSLETFSTGLNNYAVRVRLGTKKQGLPFKQEANARKQAEQLRSRGLNADVLQAEGGGWYVVVEEALDLTKVAPPINAQPAFDLLRQPLARIFGSTRQLDDLELNTLANQAEGGIGAIQEIVQPYLRTLNRLPLESKQAIGAIFKQLRDGEFASRRVNYSDEEFAVLFKRYHPQGKAPTERDLDAYHAARTINDAAYILKANRIIKQYVGKGYRAIDTGMETIPARVVGNVGRDETVYDASGGGFRLRSTFGDDVAIYETSRPLEGGVKYVANPKSIRSLNYADVYGYNAGGSRVNPRSNYFVTSGERALLSTFTEAQARLAAAQLEEIFTVARSSGKKLDDLTNELDEVLKKSNDWNPSIEDTTDFVALAKRKGWDISKKISFKKRNDIVEDAEDLYQGMTYDDMISATHHRNDDVLMDFGGDEVFNYDPVKAMVDQLSSASGEYSYQNYTYRAKTAWLKRAINPKDGRLKKGINVNRAFDTYETRGTQAQDLETLRRIIRQREFYKGPAVQAMEDYGQKLSEYVFSKSGGKIAAKLGDPTNPLLKLGFQSAFGFGNIFQFFLQSSHAFSIMAISPKAGMQAASMVLPLRIVLAADTKEAVTRFAKAFGMKVEDAEELVNYIRTSGRNLVESDAIEKGTGPGWGLAGWEGESYLPSVVRKTLYRGSKALKTGAHIGTAPFREGERLARLTGMTTAFLEYKKTYKGAKIGDAGRSWIARREQDLTFNMTTGSRAAFQNGLMRVPTQWLSYSMRAMEILTLGRGFTKAERARLGTFFVLQGGAAGIGMSWIADYLGEELQLDPKGIPYVGLKYGMFDAVISYALSGMTDEEIRTAIGTRMAPLTTLFDIKQKVMEESTFSTLGGPSTEITLGATSALFDVIGSLFSGHGNMAMGDIERFLRTASGIDNIYKAMGMINQGVYESKNGVRMDRVPFNDIEGYLQAMGITNFKVAEFYNRRTTAYRKSKDVNGFLKSVSVDFDKASRMIEEGNIEGGIKYLKEIDVSIAFSGFSPYDQSAIRRKLAKDKNSDAIMLILNELRRENTYGAGVLDSLINGSE